MDTKHTPGPWDADEFVFSRTPMASSRYVRAPGGRHWAVAEVVGMLGCTTPSMDISDAERDANAYLIAAAPDLLAACSAAEDYCAAEPGDPAYSIYRQLHAAIAKATGAA